MTLLCRRGTAAVLVGFVLIVCPTRSHADVQAQFGWPLQPRPSVSRPFDDPEQDWLPGHRGADLATTPGAVVRSAGDGVIAFAGTVVDRPVVSIDHAGGLRTTYEPVEPSVHAGQPVRRGDPIGTVLPGHDRCTATACLHWGARRGRDYLDPLRLVGVPVIRLLPLEPW